MPIPIDDAMESAAALAAGKAASAARLPRYLFLSLLAGAYVGVAVVLLISVTAPLVAASSPAAKLVSGAVFGVALTLVVFAGAELFTGNAMYLLQGVYARTATWRSLGLVWVASLIGNLVGSVGFAALVHGAGTFGVAPGQTSPAIAMLESMASAKSAATGPQLFWRAVLCNMLVCLALWMAGRTTSDGAKLGVLWWALLAFVASGFEHSVANMTLFSLAAFADVASWGDLARNLAWTVPGNVVGGGLLVGLGYAWLAGARPARAATGVAAPTVVILEPDAPPVVTPAPQPAT